MASSRIALAASIGLPPPRPTRPSQPRSGSSSPARTSASVGLAWTPSKTIADSRRPTTSSTRPEATRPGSVTTRGRGRPAGPAPRPGGRAPSPKRMRLGNVKIAGTGRASRRIGSRGRIVVSFRLDFAELREQALHLGRRVPVAPGPGLRDPRPEGPGASSPRRPGTTGRAADRPRPGRPGGRRSGPGAAPGPRRRRRRAGTAWPGRSQEGVGRVLGQALFQLHPARRFLGHHAPPRHHRNSS